MNYPYFPGLHWGRRYLVGATAALLLLLAPGARAVEQITLMTSYPEAVVSRMEELFETRYPDVRLEILWRMPNDALPYLMQPEQGGVDVYWAPARRNFRTLKQAGALRQLTIDRSGLPSAVGNTPLADPEGYYVASEMAGYGVFVDPQRLAQLGVTGLQRWEDLADPRLAGEVALPVPSAVGYAPMLVDHLLQREGWEGGWDLWRAIAANAQLINSRGNFVTEEVESGRAAVGLTMDFFAVSAIASGAKGQFIYPERTAFNPAHIAVMAASDRPELAERFVSFVLSAEGQRLLFHPAIRKLPIRPAIYAEAPEGYFNPFAADAAAEYDQGRGIARRGLNSALFDAAITRPHRALVEAWGKLHVAEAGVQSGKVGNGALLARARQALLAWPLPEPVRGDELAGACEQRQESPAAEARCAQAEQEWDRFFAEHYAEANRLLDQWSEGGQ